MINRKIITTVNLNLEFIDRAIRGRLEALGTPVPEGGELKFMLDDPGGNGCFAVVTHAVLTIETDVDPPTRPPYGISQVTCAGCGTDQSPTDGESLCTHCCIALPEHKDHNGTG